MVSASEVEHSTSLLSGVMSMSPSEAGVVVDIDVYHPLHPAEMRQIDPGIGIFRGCPECRWLMAALGSKARHLFAGLTILRVHLPLLPITNNNRDRHVNKSSLSASLAIGTDTALEFRVPMPLFSYTVISEACACIGIFCRARYAAAGMDGK